MVARFGTIGSRFGARRGALSGTMTPSLGGVGTRFGSLASGKVGVATSGNIFRVSFSLFMDRKAVKKATTKSERALFNNVGGKIRKTARRSLKVGKFIPWNEIKDHNAGKVPYSNMRTATQAQGLRASRQSQRRWARVRRSIERKGGPRTIQEKKYYSKVQRLSSKVVRPRVTSIPGQQPKLRWKRSPLKTLIIYSYDPQHHSVVVGPTPHSTGDAGTLEYGGRSRKTRNYVAARPYMRPALKVVATKYPELLRDFIRV